MRVQDDNAMQFNANDLNVTERILEIVKTDQKVMFIHFPLNLYS